MTRKRRGIFIFLLFSLLLFASCGEEEPTIEQGVAGDGIIGQEIISPLGDVIAKRESHYPAGLRSEPTLTQADNRYAEFGQGYGSSIISSEPYCRIGGQYRVKTYASNPNAGSFEETNDLYYCQTSLDLLNNIEIPESWQDSDITLYCNDGALINFDDINLDLFTSGVNAYKVCILRNNDLADRNTILYGFEVGNRQVDDNENFLFDEVNGVGPVTSGLTRINDSVLDNRVGYFQRYITVPYVQRCHMETVSVGGGRNAYYENQEVCVDVRMEGGELNTYISERVGTFVNLITYRDDPSNKRTHYSFEIPFEYSRTAHNFQDSNDEPYYFTYNPFLTLFTLTQINESLNIPLTAIFEIPANFDLSRVALFRSRTNDSKIYGYEISSSLLLPTNSTRPIYLISPGVGVEFTQQDCLQTLASYGAQPKDFITNTDTISCGSNSLIRMHSQNLDSTYGSGTGFNLFKNIILNMEYD